MESHMDMSKQNKPKTTLDEVVRSLVKAAAGSSIASQVPDDGDFERHVAQLIMKEARKKEKSYTTEGLRAYLDTPERPLRANTRFLAQVVKSTDQHNKALIRQQQEQSDRAQQQLERKRLDRRDDRGGEWSDGGDRERRHERDRRWKDDRTSERRDHQDRWLRDDHDMEWRDRRRYNEEKESPRDAGARESTLTNKGKFSEIRYGESQTVHSEGTSDQRGSNERKRQRFRSRSPPSDESTSSTSDGIHSAKKSLTVSEQNRDTFTTAERDDRHSDVESDGPIESDKADLADRIINTSGPSKVRGRGPTGSSRLDKYFEEGYDPRLDMDNFDDENIHWYVHSLQEFIDKRKSEREDEAGERKRKKDKKKKHKKKKHKNEKQSKRSKERSPSESSETSFTCEPPPIAPDVPATTNE